MFCQDFALSKENAKTRVSYSWKLLSAVLFPRTEKSLCTITTEQESIPTVQHSHFLQCQTSGKRKKATENDSVWELAILHPPSSSASGAWIYGAPNSRFRRAFKVVTSGTSIPSKQVLLWELLFVVMRFSSLPFTRARTLEMEIDSSWILVVTDQDWWLEKSLS